MGKTGGVIARIWRGWARTDQADLYEAHYHDEVLPTLQGYEVEGGFGWEAGLRTSYYVTKNVRIAVSANYEKLSDSIALSPIVAEPEVIGRKKEKEEEEPAKK